MGNLCWLLSSRLAYRAHVYRSNGSQRNGVCLKSHCDVVLSCSELNSVSVTVCTNTKGVVTIHINALPDATRRDPLNTNNCSHARYEHAEQSVIFNPRKWRNPIPSANRITRRSLETRVRAARINSALFQQLEHNFPPQSFFETSVNYLCKGLLHESTGRRQQAVLIRPARPLR